MNHPCGFSIEGIDPKDSMAIIAPAGLEDMCGLPEMFRKVGLRFIFDPGQQLNVLTGQPLLDALKGAEILISNDYELEMIMRSTGASQEDLMGMVNYIITTKGEDGSTVSQKGATHKIPIAPADKVVDPTGAGDSYRSGLMKGLSLGKDVVDACYYGAALASFSVAHHGTQEYSVTRDQFEERLAKVQALAG
jgi:adenosine kinase